MRREQAIATREQRSGDEGYLLLGALVAIAIVLIFLSVAAVNVARDLKREREEESVRRAHQYIRAIQLYYRKFGHYPGSIDQLEHTNNIRFLRKKYVDPLTGTTDWRLIEVGKNKTTVKGFFGQPLGGLATIGLGALAGSQSKGIPGPNAVTGAAGVTGIGTTTPGTPAGAAGAADTAAAANPTGGATGAASAGTAPSGAAPGAAGTAGAAGTSLGSATGQSNSPFGSNATGAFMGVGTNATGDSIIEVNEQTNYKDWEFLYDPRVEQLKQAAALNSGVGSTNATQLGQPATSANPLGAAGASQAQPGTPTQGSDTNPSTPPPNNVGVPNQP